MDVAREPRVAGSARCALASAHHHSHMRVASVAAQTDDEVPAAPFAATASPAATYAATPAHVAPAPVIEYVTPAPMREFIAPAPAVILPVPNQQLPLLLHGYRCY